MFTYRLKTPVKGYDVGAVDYLFKPIDPEILRRKVKAFCHLYKRNQKLEKDVTTLMDAEEEVWERQAEVACSNTEIATMIQSMTMGIVKTESYWRDGEDWGDYLQRRVDVIVQDTVNATQQTGGETPPEFDLQMDDLSLGLEAIAEGIAGFGAAFDIAMGNMLWTVQTQQEDLNEILATLRTEKFELETSTFRQRAEQAYISGRYAKALTDFLEAEKRNRRDFSVLRSIGKIYLYHKFDFAAALEYFEKCAKAAAPYSHEHAAEALMFAGWVCYLRREDAAAISYAQDAIEMNPCLTEAYYLHAKLAASGADAQLAVPSLEKALIADRRYWTKVEKDQDFDSIRLALENIHIRLRDKAKGEAENILQPQEIIPL